MGHQKVSCFPVISIYGAFSLEYFAVKFESFMFQPTTLPAKSEIKTSFCGCAGRFVLGLVGNIEIRECHNKKAQSIPSTKRKRNLPKTETTKLHVNNSRKTSSLFPNRGS